MPNEKLNFDQKYYDDLLEKEGLGLSLNQKNRPAHVPLTDEHMEMPSEDEFEGTFNPHLLDNTGVLSKEEATPLFGRKGTDGGYHVSTEKLPRTRITKTENNEKTSFPNKNFDLEKTSALTESFVAEITPFLEEEYAKNLANPDSREYGQLRDAVSLDANKCAIKIIQVLSLGLKEEFTIREQALSKETKKGNAVFWKNEKEGIEFTSNSPELNKILRKNFLGNNALVTRLNKQRAEYLSTNDKLVHQTLQKLLAELGDTETTPAEWLESLEAMLTDKKNGIKLARVQLASLISSEAIAKKIGQEDFKQEFATNCSKKGITPESATEEDKRAFALGLIFRDNFGLKPTPFIVGLNENFKKTTASEAKRMETRKSPNEEALALFDDLVSMKSINPALQLTEEQKNNYFSQLRGAVLAGQEGYASALKKIQWGETVITTEKGQKKLNHSASFFVVNGGTVTAANVVEYCFEQANSDRTKNKEHTLAKKTAGPSIQTPDITTTKINETPGYLNTPNTEVLAKAEAWQKESSEDMSVEQEYFRMVAEQYHLHEYLTAEELFDFELTMFDPTSFATESERVGALSALLLEANKRAKAAGNGSAILDRVRENHGGKTVALLVVAKELIASTKMDDAPVSQKLTPLEVMMGSGAPIVSPEVTAVTKITTEPIMPPAEVFGEGKAESAAEAVPADPREIATALAECDQETEQGENTARKLSLRLLLRLTEKQLAAVLSAGKDYKKINLDALSALLLQEYTKDPKVNNNFKFNSQRVNFAYVLQDNLFDFVTAVKQFDDSADKKSAQNITNTKLEKLQNAYTNLATGEDRAKAIANCDANEKALLEELIAKIGEYYQEVVKDIKNNKNALETTTNIDQLVEDEIGFIKTASNDNLITFTGIWNKTPITITTSGFEINWGDDNTEQVGNEKLKCTIETPTNLMPLGITLAQAREFIRAKYEAQQEVSSLGNGTLSGVELENHILENMDEEIPLVPIFPQMPRNVGVFENETSAPVFENTTPAETEIPSVELEQKKSELKAEFEKKIQEINDKFQPDVFLSGAEKIYLQYNNTTKSLVKPTSQFSKLDHFYEIFVDPNNPNTGRIRLVEDIEVKSRFLGYQNNAGLGVIVKKDESVDSLSGSDVFSRAGKAQKDAAGNWAIVEPSIIRSISYFERKKKTITQEYQTSLEKLEAEYAKNTSTEAVIDTTMIGSSTVETLTPNTLEVGALTEGQMLRVRDLLATDELSAQNRVNDRLNIGMMPADKLEELQWIQNNPIGYINKKIAEFTKLLAEEKANPNNKPTSLNDSPEDAKYFNELYLNEWLAVAEQVREIEKSKMEIQVTDATALKEIEAIRNHFTDIVEKTMKKAGEKEPATVDEAKKNMTRIADLKKVLDKNTGDVETFLRSLNDLLTEFVAADIAEYSAAPEEAKDSGLIENAKSKAKLQSSILNQIARIREFKTAARKGAATPSTIETTSITSAQESAQKKYYTAAPMQNSSTNEFIFNNEIKDTPTAATDYMILKLNEEAGTGTFEITGEDPRLNFRALANKEFLGRIWEVEDSGVFAMNATGVETVTPGTVVKKNGAWVVEKKTVIRYTGPVTPETNLEQTPVLTEAEKDSLMTAQSAGAFNRPTMDGLIDPNNVRSTGSGILDELWSLQMDLVGWNWNTGKTFLTVLKTYLPSAHKAMIDCGALENSPKGITSIIQDEFLKSADTKTIKTQMQKVFNFCKNLGK